MNFDSLGLLESTALIPLRLVENESVSTALALLVVDESHRFNRPVPLELVPQLVLGHVVGEARDKEGVEWVADSVWVFARVVLGTLAVHPLLNLLGTLFPSDLELNIGREVGLWVGIGILSFLTAVSRVLLDLLEHRGNASQRAAALRRDRLAVGVFVETSGLSIVDRCTGREQAQEMGRQ